MLGSDLQKARFHDADSEWLRSFALKDMKVLVVCRGPVRMEAFEVFDDIGLQGYGMLLSEKDSIVYPRCLAPEIRSIPDQRNIHRVADYMGAGQEEKMQRIREIIAIAHKHDYTHIFAGYGFMAEDADFVQAIEDAQVGFLGPSASVIRRAGAKDEAKKLARGLGNAVIPGVDDISSRALVARVSDQAGLETLCAEHKLKWKFDPTRSLEENAEALLQAGYSVMLELVTIEELQEAAALESKIIWEKYPDKRIRFKCIGGGGGKGQRVVSSEPEIADAVMEILAEQKVTEPGSNRNFLIELNLETTRHNEIQVLGNGDWAVTLGGRDCSIQMREQKQLEFSLTEELIAEAASRYQGQQKETLEKDGQTLQAMETDAERFAVGVGLDSVSTFECIVEKFDHFFMEMNTRIQVEHGVSELAYMLKFTNPDNPEESFYIDRLIEVMALLAVHGSRLPRPEREPRNISGAEIRVNATNAALQPHAGGIIRQWSAPLPYEIRDDQGIGTRNPDTGSFMYYNLAGAYDSNITLILSPGENREHNLQRLSEILRRNEIRGDNLETNIPVQYGLINWTLGIEPMMKPNTRFLTHYLAAVGSLQIIARDVDLSVAAAEATRKLKDAESRKLLASKETLLLRPLGRLLSDPHALAGFIGLHHGRAWHSENNQSVFLSNPVQILHQLYHYLNLDYESGKPPSEMIWEDDDRVLNDALSFYAEIEKRTEAKSWSEIEAILAMDTCDAVSGGDAELWSRCQGAHRGHQLGMEFLLMIPQIAVQSGFSDIQINESLEPEFPEQYTDPEITPGLIRTLAPPPPASANEIVTPMAGTFYGREAPHLPVLIEEGDHFEAGQPLFIIEVMKMFNKILAPFSGTVTKNLMDESDGQILSKGEQIFEIEPDEAPIIESEEEISERQSAVTLGLMVSPTRP